MKHISILLFASFTLACGTKKKEKDNIPIDKMKVVVWQLMQADEVYSRKILVDSTWKIQRKNVQFYQQIFDLNKVDREHFYQQLAYLESHPVEFKTLMDSVEALSKREKNEAVKH